MLTLYLQRIILNPVNKNTILPLLHLIGFARGKFKDGYKGKEDVGNNMMVLRIREDTGT
jgi:hypothetical protein